MSEWFLSIPIALDNIAQAAKAGLDDRTDLKFRQYFLQFQQETLASQIRYYKPRYQQQRVLIERLKRESAEVKKY